MSGVEERLARLSIVLVRPKYAENIGSAARAVCNMGLGRLLVVGSPPTDLSPALKTATHNAAHLVQGLCYCDSVAEAVAGCGLVVGSTARTGRQRRAMAAPYQLAELLLPALASGRVAILFGPEDKGLANADLDCCGLLVTIPTAAQFSSMNLGQAVAILCYELRQGLMRLAGQEGAGLYRPRTAGQEELSAMLTAASLACQALDQSSGQQQAANRLRQLRAAVRRWALSAREAKLFKDACHQVAKALGGATKSGE